MYDHWQRELEQAPLIGGGMTRTVLAFVNIVGFAMLLVGCANLGPVTPVPVSDVKSVSGTWRGIVYAQGSEPEQVMLTIRDDGSYDLASAQNIGVSRGHGKIVINQGRLLIEGERGRGVGTLLTNPAGDLVMNIEATLSDNSTLTATLSRDR